jgi:RNA polymerase sigma-70 factor (ECF subfamily)
VEDLNIIKRCLKGIKSAQRELYTKYRRAWYFICLRYAEDSDDANDMLQDALVRIYSNLHAFKSDKGSFQAWSSAIVVNQCLMVIRKRKGLRSKREQYVSEITMTQAATVVNRMTAKEILALVQALPDGYRAVFNMYAIEGYSHKEISQLLDISIGTSKSQLHKARKMLQEMVSEIFEVVYP